MKHPVYFNIVIFVCVWHASASLAQTIFVRDLWTNQPLAQVQIISPADTLYSDQNGRFELDLISGDIASVQLKLEGYFDLVILKEELREPLLYLMPVEATALITVVQPRAPDSRLMLPAHITRIELDPLQMVQHSTIAEILRSENGLFFKSYGGPGQMQSISVRGMSPEQTQVLFDGVPLNSLQLGSVDLGQYFLQNIGSIDIYRGGNSLFGGSGAIGGSIDLHPPKPRSEIGYYFNHTISSFNNHSLGTQLDLPFLGFEQYFMLNFSRGDNNYTTNFENQPVTLQNRDYQRGSFAYYTGYRFSGKFEINSFINSLKNESGSPEPFINPLKEQSNLARLKNDNTLFKLQMLYRSTNTAMLVQGYLRNEWMEYNNPALLIDYQILHSLHFNHESGLQARWRYLLSETLLIHSGAEVSWQRIRSSEAGKHQRRRTAAYLISDWQLIDNFFLFRSIHLNGTLRTEFYTDIGKVILPGLGLSFKRDHWQFFIAGGRNYRAATFNELYWQPGGNPNLNAEKSFNTEMGFEYAKALRQQINFTFNTYAYLNKVHDQIKWLPQAAYWTPQNIAQVTSQGIELESTVSDLRNIHQIAFNYRYGIAEKSKAEFPGDLSVGNQLPYLPREQWNLKVRSGFWLINYGFRLEGMSFRYTNIQNDVKQILPAHYTAGLWLALHLEVLKQRIMVSGKIENLFNNKYETIQGYPMPPRNYSLSLAISY